MSTLRIILFCLTMLLYFIVPVSMIYQQENVLKVGETFRFRTRPIDPYDAFRGRYINLRYNTWTFPYPHADSIFTKKQPIYAQFKSDTLGYAQINAISTTPFDAPNYIKTNIKYTDPSTVTLNIPDAMQRYYMNEVLAPRADSIYFALMRAQRQSNPDTALVYIDVKIHEGTALIKDVYVQGVPINAALRQK